MRYDKAIVDLKLTHFIETCCTYIILILCERIALEYQIEQNIVEVVHDVLEGIIEPTFPFVLAEIKVEIAHEDELCVGMRN